MTTYLIHFYFFFRNPIGLLWRIDIGRGDAMPMSLTYHPGLRNLAESLLNMSVQNFGTNFPIEYATSTPWEDSSLLF